MPHGRLTTLGRQLASVLANLRPASTCPAIERKPHNQRWISVDKTSWARARRSAIRTRDAHDAQLRRQSAAAACVCEETIDETSDDEYGVGRLGGIEHEVSLKQEGEESHGSGTEQPGQFPDLLQSYVPISYVTETALNASLLRGKEYPMYYSKNRSTLELRLEEILYRHLEHGATRTDVPQSNWVDSLQLSGEEEDLLVSTSYTASTIKTWASAVIHFNTHETAVFLEQLQHRSSADAIPLFVLFHVLRKPYISARTLRVLLKVSFEAVERYHSREGTEGLHKEDLYTLFTLLLRRVRDVWPAAMNRMVDMLLRYLPHKPPDTTENDLDGERINCSPRRNDKSVLRERQLASLAFRLNKAMRLLAIPTSINPFKTIQIQEACVIRVLRYLTEHDPPLEINRDGFRAIVLLQLAQPKSENDHLWAELKTLSWPPWKEDRTAMDADITAREHGRSKAAETLERMREAGFAPYEWERAAAIYTGWDTDRTPTIQTRVKFSSGKKRFASGATDWTARIHTTRNIQEAWACYLAYEEQCSEPDQDACRTMFQKIYQESNRAQERPRYKHFRKVRLEKGIWPGDAVEIEPPPPSTHQHTYTRTAPPKFDAFYRQLKKKGVVFEGHCLAFLVSKAGSLKLGLEYLSASASIYPAIRGLLNDSSVHDLSSLPDVVFASFMELLGRFSNFSLSKALPLEFKDLRYTFSDRYDLENLSLNADHALIHGIMLLKRRLPLYRPAWHSILRALGNSSSHMMLNVGLAPVTSEPVYRLPPRPDLRKQMQAHKAAFTARGLVRRLLTMMHNINLEIDTIGFMALCNVAENWAVNCWLELRKEVVHGEEFDWELGDMAKTLKRRFDPKLMQLDFFNLVGEEDAITEIQKERTFELPQLLEVPSPAILHAYIRVLGWMGDYLALSQTVEWMVKYQSALQERRSVDRNGDIVMRRAITALRVFLTRSWLYEPQAESRSPQMTEDVDEQPELDIRKWPLKKHLTRLRTPADSERTKKIKELVESVEDWGGWPTDEEVEEYCKHERFQQFNR